MSEVHEVVIVGSGPAGLTAAVYAGRANLAPVVLEGIGAGGQLMLTTDVENYPGFPDGILGPELMIKFREQAAALRRRVRHRRRRSRRPSRRHRSACGSASASSARGRSSSAPAPRRACSACPNEQRLLGHGVSTCATCDGFFFREKPIAVIGGGDSAIEEALFLTKFATSVTVVHRRDELRASKIMQDRVFANPKIDFLWNTVVEDVVGNGSVESLKTARHRDRRGVRARGRRRVRRDRPRSQHRAVPRPTRSRRRRLHRHRRRLHAHVRRRRVRRRATCRTTCTSRRSPRRGAVAWPRSKPSVG